MDIQLGKPTGKDADLIPTLKELFRENLVSEEQGSRSRFGY
jgi:hypothetical protein